MAWWPLLPLSGYGGLAEALFKMAFGNRIGFRLTTTSTADALFKPAYGTSSWLAECSPGRSRLVEARRHVGEHHRRTTRFECCGEKLDLAAAAGGLGERARARVSRTRAKGTKPADRRDHRPCSTERSPRCAARSASQSRGSSSRSSPAPTASTTPPTPLTAPVPTPRCWSSEQPDPR